MNTLQYTQQRRWWGMLVFNPQLLSSMNLGLKAGLNRPGCCSNNWCQWLLHWFFLQILIWFGFVIRYHVVLTKNNFPCMLCLANQGFDCMACFLSVVSWSQHLLAGQLSLSCFHFEPANFSPLLHLFPSFCRIVSPGWEEMMSPWQGLPGGAAVSARQQEFRSGARSLWLTSLMAAR